MKPAIQNLLGLLETAEPDVKLSCLLDIGDYLEHPYPHEAAYVDTVQQLVVLLGNETDPAVGKQLVRMIERAFMYPVNLSGIDFEQLTGLLERADPYMIRSVLYLFSMTFDRKYIPLIEQYVKHPDEEVRKEAEQLLASW